MTKVQPQKKQKMINTRLDTLPNELVTNITSFLSLKYVVRMKYVSRQLLQTVRSMKWDRMDVASITKFATKKQLDQYFPADQLTRLDFIGCQEVSDMILNYLDRCSQNIHTVHFIDCPMLSSSTIERVLNRCRKTVERVSIVNCDELYGGYSLAHLTNLRYLDASGTRFFDNQIEDCSKLDLVELRAGESDVLNVPNRFREGTSLKVLKLKSCPITESNLSVLKCIQTLEDLSFEDCEYDSKTGNAVQLVCSLGNLQSLSIRVREFTRRDLEHLCNGLGSQLTRLTLHGAVKSNNWDVFSRVKKLKSLTIDLSLGMKDILEILRNIVSTELTDLSFVSSETLTATYVTELVHIVPQLRKLNLANNNFEESSLLELRSLNNLEELILDKCNQMETIALPGLPSLRKLSLQSCVNLKQCVFKPPKSCTVWVSQEDIAKQLCTVVPSIECVVTGVTLFIDQLKTKQFQLCANLNWKASELKEAIYHVAKVKTINQTLVFASKALDSDIRLCRYRITNESKIMLLVRPGRQLLTTSN